MATGSRTPWVRQQFFDDNGNPLSGGLIDTYIAGSTTPINTYTDITLTTIHTNPIVLNTRGETTIFLDPTVAYKFVLRNPLPDGSEIWTQDNITALGGGSLLTDLGVIRSKVVGSATLPVPLATNVVIPYDTADYEVNLTGFDGAANKWVCALDGVYDLNAAVDFTIQSSLAAPSASCEIFFLVNGVTSKNPKKWAFTTDSSGGQKTLETSGTLQLTKNDEVQVVFVSPIQGSGTSIDLILGDAFWDIISLSGVKGNTGDQGPAGPAGVGVPVGGTANQVLAKIDATDYNTQWVNDTSSPSQGVSGIINVADGSGGWLAMDGSARPLFEYSSTTGNLSYTGGNFLVSETIQATDKFDIAYDGGQLRFRDTTNTVTLGRMYVVKDSLGVGQHQMVLADAKRITIPFELNSIDAVFFPNIFNPGTDVGKHMVITDDVTGKVEKRPVPSAGLPSDFIICRSSAEVLAALSLTQDYKTIFLYAGAEIVNPSAINTPIDVYGQNVILGSISLVTISTLIPTNTLQFQRTGAGFTSIRISGLALSLFPGIIGGANVVDLDNVTIISDNLSTPPAGYTVNGAGGALYWKFLQDLAIPTAGTAIARQAFTNTWGMTNTFSVANETDFIKYLQMDLPVKILNIVTDTIALSSSTITGVTGRVEIYGTNLSISIPSSGTLSIEAASTPIKEISFFVSRLNLVNVTTLNLENVSFRARTLVNSPPGTTNVTSTATGTGSLSYENPDLTGAIVFTGLATQTFWDNTLIDAFGKLPAVDGSQLTNLPSGGSPSQGAAGIINIADGSGGWLAMDGSARPLLEWSSTTGNLSFTSGNFLISETIQATDKLEVINDSGEIRFRDASDTITLARFRVLKDNLGTGLHELGLLEAKRFTIPNDFRVQGDVSFTGVVDPGTDTGKKMLVIDTATKTIQERPVPSSLDNTKLAILNNLSDLNSVPTARTNLGLGTAAVLDTGTGANNIVQLDGTSKLPAVDGSQLTNVTGTDNTKLAILNNFSDLNSVSTARTNLGLGTAAVLDVGTSANNIVQLDGTGKLPAVDGSQLTNLPGGGTPSALPIMVLTSTEGNAPFSGTSPLTVGWNQETEKDAGFTHSTTTNKTRAYVDNDGTYLIQGRLRVLSSAQRAQPTVDLLKNGSIIQSALDCSYIRNAGGSSDYWTLNFAYQPVKLIANDYLEVKVGLDIGNTSSFACSLVATESSLSIINLQGTKGDTGAQGPGGTDTNAVHVNVANEIAQITAKAVPSVDDVLIIEDSADSNNKKKVSVGALRNGVESFTNPSSLAPDASLITQINANAQAQTLTLSVPTNPFDGAKIIYRIRAASTSTLTWNAAFNDLQGNLPTSAPINKTIYVGVIYDGYSSTWDVVSVVEQS